MIKIGIRNFQIIEKLLLPLEGIVAITGPSNNGKTSVARAIEACLYNWSGDSFINDHSAESCVVGITFPESRHHPELELVWEKPRGSGATYRINGEVYNKTKGMPLKELLEMGFSFLETPRVKFKLNFWEQMGLFLVNESPSTTFDVLSRLLEDRKLLPILKKMKDDITTSQKDAVRLEGQFQLANEAMQALMQERNTYDKFVVFQPKIIHIKNCRETLSKLYTLRENYQQHKQLLDTRHNEINIIKPLLNTLVKNLSNVQKKLDILQSLEILNQKRQAMIELEKNRKRLTYAKQSLEKLEKANIQKILTIESQSSRLQQLRKHLADLVNITNQYDNLVSINKKIMVFETRLNKLAHLDDLIVRLSSLEEREQKIAALQEQAYEEQQQHSQEFDQFKQDAGVCPECNGTGFIGGCEHE